jgi:AraC-like DNA-binding protein
LNSYKALNIISKYAEKKELSSRTINRWFVNEIGISPKKLSRVMRFHKALLVLHSYKEAGFYIDVGYFDQAHFIKEFKEFTGQSPEAYLTMVSDLYNQ